MKKKILNYLWLIPLIIGVVIGIIGIAKVKKAKDMYVPEMGDPGWFDASTKQTDAEAGGIMMIASGFGFLGLFGSIATFAVVKTVTSKNFKSMKELQKSLVDLNDSDEEDESDTNILEKISNLTKQKDEPLFCEYCGAMLKKDATSCDACGARCKK